MEKIKKCAIALSAVGVLVMMIATFADAMNTPEVIFSWSTKKCVRVQFMDGSVGSCDHLPEKYDHIWGK